MMEGGLLAADDGVRQGSSQWDAVTQRRVDSSTIHYVIMPSVWRPGANEFCTHYNPRSQIHGDLIGCCGLSDPLESTNWL